jgi:hypothetical protein
MSTAVMTERIPEASPRLTARAAGFFWLMTFLGGIFALSSGGLVVSGNAAATAANILAHESLFRSGVVANLTASVCYIAATLFVYYLLKPVNRKLSLLAAFFSLTGCAGGTVTFALQFAPLVVLGGAQYLSVFTLEQLQALALAFLSLAQQAFLISHVFFGLHCLLVGYLILGAKFLPRIVGALMVFAGLGWLTMSFANLLSPPLGRSLFPYVLLPGMLGEGSLTLWLLLVGVNVGRWKAQAGRGGAIAI